VEREGENRVVCVRVEGCGVEKYLLVSCGLKGRRS
jgi:hypothetical protein